MAVAKQFNGKGGGGRDNAKFLHGKVVKRGAYDKTGGGKPFGRRPSVKNGRQNFKRYKESMEVVGRGGAPSSRPFDFKNRFKANNQRPGSEVGGAKRNLDSPRTPNNRQLSCQSNGLRSGPPGQFQKGGPRSPGQFRRGSSRSPGQWQRGGSRSPGQWGNKSPGRKLTGSRTPNADGGKFLRKKSAQGDAAGEDGEPMLLKRKRVSFSNTLEHSRTIDDVNAQQGSTTLNVASPGKGILRAADKDFNGVDKKLSAAEPDEQLPEMVLPTKAERAAKQPLKASRVTREQLAAMDKKTRREHIRALKQKKHVNFTLALEAKMLWEKVRSKCKADEKEKCIKQLLALVQGRLKELIYAHDTCRVIECLMALNREEIRNALFEELVPEIVRMTKSTYARFFVNKMLKYGSKHQRGIVIGAVRGHCVAMLKSANSAKVLELIYNDHANASQRFQIVSEFYGPEYVIFRDEIAELKSLEGIVEKHPEKKDLIVKNLDGVLQKVVTKETLKMSLTHKLLHDYLRYCTAEQRDNLIESLKTNLPEITHTMDGAKVALLCLWNANAKDRKAIVKSFKGLVLNACKDRYARRVIFGVFDCVDDTALVNKYITSDISNNIAELAYDKNGADVLHYIIHPRDVRHFTKWIMPMMSEGDSNVHSKKAMDVRYSEIFDCIKSNLFAFLAANIPTLIMSPVAATIALNALEPPSPDEPFQRVVDEADKIACFKAIVKVLSGDIYSHELKDEPHILRFGPPRFVFRKLMKMEPRQSGAKLSDYIADLPREHLASFITLESGCFTLVEVMQSGSEKGRRAVVKAVNLAALRESKLMGAHVLLDEVTRCLTEMKTAKK